MDVASTASRAPSESPAEVYDRLGPKLVEVAYLLTSNRADAQDLVHDAFVAALPRWSTIAAPDAYLRRSVTHAAYKVSRDRRRRADKHRRLGVGRLEAVDPIDFLADQIQGLPDKQRAVIVLRFYLGLSHAEIAELLPMRPGSVGPTLTRALRRLEGGMPA
jgi:RNA polymerase sigma factor (sigma-70 family)